MLQLFNKIRTPVSLATKSIRYFSVREESDSLAIEPTRDLYQTYRKEEFSNLYSIGYQQRIPGYATSKGTRYYAIRKDLGSEDHFKKTFHDELSLSSIGVGTYVGSPTELDDLKMFNGIIESVETGGVNVIDTAINFRYQKSERVVGAALRYLLREGFTREELFVSSKNGYIPEDGDKGIDAEFYVKSLLEKGKITNEDIIKDKTDTNFVHCIHPNFLEDQLERTLTNIGIETLDVYYLQNAAESQIPRVGYQAFLDRLATAFEFCEKKAEQGKLRAYGLATWACFRTKTLEKDLHLSLQDVVEVAKKVGGDSHKFRYIQLPFNLIMPEAFLEKWQDVKQGDQTTKETLLQAAKTLKVNVITTSPLAQGLMMQVPMNTDIYKASNLGAKHLQFSRSVPSQALISTLVGQKTARHVKKNLEVIQYPKLNDEDWLNVMKPVRRRPLPDEAVESED